MLQVIPNDRGEFLIRPTTYNLDMAVFVKAFGDKHIVQASYDLYATHQEPFPVVIAVSAVKVAGRLSVLVGLSLVVVDYDYHEPGKVINPHASITVVHNRYRKLGLGSEMVKIKRAILASYGLELIAEVSERNGASKRMLEKAGLVPVASREAVSAQGRTFTALSYSTQEGGSSAESTSSADDQPTDPQP